MAKRATHEREDRVLDELCEQLEHREGVGVRVVNQPDRDERREQAVDAVMQRGVERWAVEHTRVFDRADQLGDHDRLRAVAPIIQDAVEAAFPGHWVLVALPMEEFAPGRDWARMAQLVAEAAIAKLPSLPEGQGWQLDVEGFNRRPVVDLKRRNTPDAWCRAVVLGPQDDDQLRAADVRRALVDKRTKVEAMRSRGFKTMLVMDTVEKLDASSLMASFTELATAELVQPYDEIYLALSGWEPAAFELLKSGARWPLYQPEHAEFVDLWNWAREKWEAEGRPVR